MPAEGSRAPWTALHSLRPMAGRALQEWRSRGGRREAVRMLAEAIGQLPSVPGLPDPAEWTVRRVMRTETDVTVAVFGTAEDGDVAVARLGAPGEESPGLRRNNESLTALLADDRLAQLHPLLPVPLAIGTHGDRTYAVERAIRGTTAHALRGRPGALDAAAELGASAIGILHRATAAPGVVTADDLERWTAGPFDVLRGALSRQRREEAAPALERLASELCASLGGRPCSLSWTHGDLWTGNLLLDDRGERLVGIVDWDAATARGLPAADLVHLVLATRGRAEKVPFGLSVVEILDGRPWGPWDGVVLGAFDDCLPDLPDAGRVTTLLMWLAHVGAVLGKQPVGAAHDRWIADNVEPVLARL